jgi:hypothetical protein
MPHDTCVKCYNINPYGEGAALCTKCEIGICYECITPYDSITRLLILRGKCMMDEFDISPDAFEQFLDDIQSDVFKKELVKYDGVQRETLEIEIESMKHTPLSESKIKEFFMLLLDKYCFILSDVYVCLMCHKNIVVEY